MNSRKAISAIVALALLPSLLFSSIGATSVGLLDVQSLSNEGDPRPNAGATAYHTYDEMVTELFQIATDHSSITDLTSIGTSFEGRDIWSMKISDNAQVEEDEPEVIIYAMHHSREWMTTEVCMYIINFLTGNYSTNSSVQSIVDNREVWIIPIVNPDGRVYDGEDDPAVYNNWRKNRVPNGDGSSGVDLNRNYDFMWGGAGSSDDPSNEVYRGPTPFSEKETQAIRDLALRHDFVFSLSYHSYGQIILYPWGNTLNPSEDDDLFSALGWGMSNRMTNKAASPRTRYIPMRGSQLYLTSGDDVDWMYGELGVLPFVVELYPSFSDSSPAVTPPYNGFHPREDKIIPVCEDNLGGALFLLEIADNPNQVMPHISVTATPDRRTIDRGQNLSFQVDILNDGNQPETIDLSATFPSGWNGALIPNVINLANGDNQTVDLWVEVPPGEWPGDFEIDISASSVSASASTMVTVHVPYRNDVGVSSIAPFQEGQLYPMGNYSIQAEITNYAPNWQDPFNVMMDIWELGPLEERQIFYEGFESGIADWTIVDYDGPTSSDVWHPVSGLANSGSYSVWIGDDGAGMYSDTTLQMLQSPSFNLEGASGANLSFYHVLGTESTYDFAVVEVGCRGDWKVLQSWSGWVSPFSFTEVVFDLSEFIGCDDVRMSFRFSSDEHLVDLGWYIDDISVNATLPRETLIHGPVLESTITQMNQGESEYVSWKYKFKRAGHFKIIAMTLNPFDENLSNDSAEVSFFIDPTRYRVFLTGGMNLVSYPLITADRSSSAILATIQDSYDGVWKNWGDPKSWSSYSDRKPWPQGIQLGIADGWWIRVGAETYYDVTGTIPGTVSIPLKAGWNMVGYPTLTDRTVAETLLGLPYTRVESFDPLAPYHLKAMGDNEYMTTGMGYWIYVEQDTTWFVSP
jgi:carboxypeptidase T